MFLAKSPGGPGGSVNMCMAPLGIMFAELIMDQPRPLPINAVVRAIDVLP
jgi:hypothetical protein